MPNKPKLSNSKLSTNKPNKHNNTNSISNRPSGTPSTTPSNSGDTGGSLTVLGYMILFLVCVKLLTLLGISHLF